MTSERRNPHAHDTTGEYTAPPLNAEIKAILDEDIAQGFSIGIASDLHEALQRTGEIDQTHGYVAQQMAAVIEYLDVHDRKFNSGSQDSTYYGARTRVLSTVDVLVQYPEQVQSFLEYPTVSESPRITDPAILELAPVRFWNNGGADEATVQLLDFSLKQAPDDEAIATRFAASLSSDAPADRFDSLYESLQALTPETSHLIASAIAKRQEAVEERERAEAERQQAYEARLAEAAIRRAAEQAEREAARQRQRDVLQAIDDDPETAYEAFLSEYDPETTPDEQHLAVLAARTYLSMTKNTGDQIRTAKAIETLETSFKSMLATDTPERALAHPDYPAVRRHLNILIPDMAVLTELVRQYPFLDTIEDFYSDWKNAVINERIRQKAEALIGTPDARQLKEQQVNSFDITIKQLGVPYVSVEELIDDLRGYFVYTIGDQMNTKIDHANRVNDSVTVGRIASAWSRSDNEILQKDIIEPFNQWYGDLQRWQPTGRTLHVFETQEAQQGGSPYKYETTTFAGHAISIAVDMSRETPTFYLNMRGGGYDSDAYAGERLERFAAFVGKEVAYPEEQAIRVAYESAYIDATDEELSTLDQAHADSGIPPYLEQSPSHAHRPWRAETWFQPYDKTPNNTLKNLLREVLGDGASLKYTTDPYSYNTERQFEEAGDGPIPEARLGFRRFTLLDAETGDDNRVNRHLVISNAAEFSVTNATPTQAQQLKFLQAAYRRG